jgi:hypothetical protein
MTTKKAKSRRPPERKLALAHPLFAATPAIDDVLVRAYNRARARFMHRDNVTGVDIGLERRAGVETGKLAVRVHIREKIDARRLAKKDLLPRTLDGARLDVIESDYVPHAGPQSRHLDPIQPGISVGHPNASAGTSGLVVKDGQGRLSLLSAAHVLIPDSQSNPGDPILQPGPADGGRVAVDTCAVLTQFDLGSDSAIAAFNAVRQVSTAIYGTAVTPSSIRPPAVGDILTKVGLATGLTMARVDGVAGPYDGVDGSFYLMPRKGETGLICRGGDSGAVWYDATTGAAVGMHSGGSRFPSATDQFAVAAAYVFIFDRLGITLPD